MTKRIGVYIYENMTMLDVFGPMQFLAFVPDVELVTIAVSENPITTDAGIRVTPNYSVANAPDIDILLVGGAGDPSRELADPEVMSWFRKAGERAEYVTSVCTGALFLAEAGLLDGYQATTHWAYLEDLSHYPIEIVRDARVVRDRNRITGGSQRFELHHVYADDEYGVVHVRESATRVADNRTLDIDEVHLIVFGPDGRIADFRDLPSDPALHDAFFDGR